MGSVFDKFLRRAPALSTSNAVEQIFDFKLECRDFVEFDIELTYKKILVDVLERTTGITTDINHVLWDNCVQDDSNEGLISILVDCMINKSDVYLVYKKSVKVLRKATSEEEVKIKQDYKKNGRSNVGVFISFKNYRRTEVLKIYSELEHAILASLYKSVNISKAVQLKINQLRQSVSEEDAPIAEKQAVSIADGLRKGKDVFLDKDDEITTATPSTEATEKAIHFLNAKRAYILSMPLSYIDGEQTGGIGTTGESDMRAVERGLLQYFFEIIQPVFKALFGIDVKFRSQDTRYLTSAREMLSAFDVLTTDLLSRKTMQELVAQQFNLNAEEELRRIESEEGDRLERQQQFERENNRFNRFDDDTNTDEGE